jgi:hypothetical protein
VKNSSPNLLYFRLNKKDKCVDHDEQCIFSKFEILSDLSFFSVAYNTPNSELRFCRIVDLKVIYINKFHFFETFKMRFSFL